MLALCFRYCDTLEEAEDVLQEGFIKVFTSIGQCKKRSRIEAWMRTIMVNTALNYLRSIAGFRFSEELEGMPETVQPSVMPDNTMEVDHLIETIKDLPIGYRTVFNLYEVEGYSHAEIAEMLNVSINTSKSQLRKARQQLQEQLKGYNKP